MSFSIILIDYNGKSINRFSHAAIAFENCDKKFKAVFAEPKITRSQDSGSLDRSSSNHRSDDSFSSQNNSSRNNSSNKRSPSRDLALFMNQSAPPNKQTNNIDVEYQLNIICSDNVSFIPNYNIELSAQPN